MKKEEIKKDEFYLDIETGDVLKGVDLLMMYGDDEKFLEDWHPCIFGENGDVISLREGTIFEGEITGGHAKGIKAEFEVVWFQGGDPVLLFLEPGKGDREIVVKESEIKFIG